tara:strand:+ start:183 stop:761 length:579 start_codon:yes stop_codon:yes gene_type:complete
MYGPAARGIGYLLKKLITQSPKTTKVFRGSSVGGAREPHTLSSFGLPAGQTYAGRFAFAPDLAPARRFIEAINPSKKAAEYASMSAYRSGGFPVVRSAKLNPYQLFDSRAGALGRLTNLGNEVVVPAATRFKPEILKTLKLNLSPEELKYLFLRLKNLTRSKKNILSPEKIDDQMAELMRLIKRGVNKGDII